MQEDLYRKIQQGKRVKYELAYSAKSWDAPDLMKPGTFRMTYAYSEGGRRYEWDVTPDTASFVAASMLFKEAMENAIKAKVIATPQGTSMYNKKQLAALEKCKQIMVEANMLLPTHWTHTSAWELSEAAVNAIRGHQK